MNGQEKSAYQYLLTLVRLQREEPDRAVSLEAVSNEFGVNRSTVLRALRRYREDGTLDERYRLTPQGEGWLNSENQQVYRLEGFLKEHQIPEAQIRQDSLTIIKNCSRETAMLLSNMGYMCNSCRRYVSAGANKWSSLSGEEFLEKCGDRLQPGEVRVMVLFRREQGEGLKERSMASEGFERTGTLRLSKGQGELVLERKMLSHQSLMGKWYEGNARMVEYESSGCWEPIHIQGDRVSIPLNAFWITYREDQEKLRGMTRLRMACSAGPEAMKQSSALLEFRVWK